MQRECTLGPLVADREEAAPREKANVSASRGIYESVLVAGFGGVRYSMAKGKTVMVHPFFLLVSCLPVCSVQLTAVYALRMDLKLSKNIFAGEFDSCLLTVKLLMAAVVGLINFQRMLNSVFLLFFSLNPHSWVEVYSLREELTTTGLRHRIEVTALLACVALTMSTFVNYTVCIDSISIILAGESVQDVIFDCVALSFLQDLNEYWWHFLVKVFHLSPLEDFTFEMDHTSRIYTEEGDLTPEKADMFVCPGLMEPILNCTFCLGSGPHCAEVMSVLVLFLLYQRQLFILLLAVKTGVLPAARDICVQYRLSKGVAYWLWHAFDKFILIDITQKVKDLAATDLNKCRSDRYASMSLGHMVRVGNEHPMTVGVGLFLFGAILVIPKLMRVVWGSSASTTEKILDEQELVEEVGFLQRRQNFTDLRLQRLEENLQMLLQRGHVSGGLGTQSPRGWGLG